MLGFALLLKLILKLKWKYVDFCDIIENMDIKDLDKKQLILLTLLITFIVSIATGIITVSLMNQMPKSVPYTVNNVIQRTIEKVTTVSEPVKTESPKEEVKQDNAVLLGDGNVLIKIYKEKIEEGNVLGEGVLLSDTGLVLVDSNILNNSQSYLVVLNQIEFSAGILKTYGNGFTILNIKEKEEVIKEEAPKEEIKTETEESTSLPDVSNQ